MITMKKVIFLKNGSDQEAEIKRYLNHLKNALDKIGIANQIKDLDKDERDKCLKNAMKLSTKACKTKANDEIYFSLSKITCADICKVSDGVYKIYRLLKRFWFLNPMSFIYVYLEKKCFTNAKKIIVSSNLTKQQIINTYKIDESKIITIYNGINLPSKIEKGSAKMRLCAKFGLDYELPIVLFVSNKTEEIKEFLEILSKLNTKFNAILISNDKKSNKFKKLATKLGINALFIGRQRIISGFYEGSDLLLLPTYYESFSNAILEALSYGCVAITTAQNGASEILENDFIMQDPKDHSITTFIDKLFLNNEFMANIQAKNVEFSKNFSIEKSIDQTVNLISQIVYQSDK